MLPAVIIFMFSWGSIKNADAITKHDQILKKNTACWPPNPQKILHTRSNIQLKLLIPINTNSKTTQLSSLRLGDLFISVFQLAFGYLQSKLPGFIEPFLGTLQVLFLLLTWTDPVLSQLGLGEKNQSWRKKHWGPSKMEVTSQVTGMIFVDPMIGFWRWHLTSPKKRYKNGSFISKITLANVRGD